MEIKTLTAVRYSQSSQQHQIVEHPDSQRRQGVFLQITVIEGTKQAEVGGAIEE